MSTLSQSQFLKLLQQVADGVTIYEPFLHTPEGLREFEDTVARLQEMEQLGLVKRLFTQTRTSSGNGQVVMVMVVGGLTDEGRRMLSDHDAYATD